MAAKVYLLVTLLSGVTAFSNDTVDHLAKGNALWRSLFANCQKPSTRCIEDTMYSYLKETFEYPADLHVTSFMSFRRNGNHYQHVEEDDVTEEARGAFEEMSSSLKDKSLKFLVTHDLELQMPETLFEGSTLRVSPRGFEDNGPLVKLELVPKQNTGIGEGRIFFKKIKKKIGEKLLYALMAILLVIKLLAAKFMFFLPMMVGAVTAKKLLIKVLLFIFPAMHHLFKLCAYVPHGTKFHHHNHHIAHVHHLSPHKHHHGYHSHHHPHDAVEVIRPHAEGPPSLGDWHGPSLHHSIDLDPPHQPSYNPEEQEFEYYTSGVALGDHLINNRQDSDNEIHAWGQGQRKKTSTTSRPKTPSEIEAMILKAEKEAQLKARLQHERQRIQEENAKLQEQLKQAMKLQEKLKQQAASVKFKVPHVPSTYQQPPSLQRPIYSSQVKQPEKRAELSFEKALHEAATITYDAFYSPILEKIDKILAGLGFHDEPCRERLICSMYKDPAKFSPHSNLLSAELSRDSSELQKPSSTNAAVVRFYRYVQAARDGQDKRECLRLYASCSINTELWNAGVK